MQGFIPVSYTHLRDVDIQFAGAALTIACRIETIYGEDTLEVGDGLAL